jgi:uncharacterized protein
MGAKQGFFIWYDLMTGDLAAAEAFYAKVVGWKIADSGMPGMKYSMLNAGDTQVGGMMGFPPDMPKDRRQPMWGGYIGVDDVDAMAKRVEKAGGMTCNAAQDIPGVGRFAAMADPHGALFYLFKPSSGEQPKPEAMNAPGHIGWRELNSGDWAKAWDFYAGLFGWEKQMDMDMGPMGTYRIFDLGNAQGGGMMTKTPDTPSPMWQYYFNVEAADAAVERVKQAGGKILMEPMEVPGGQWAMSCADPEGAVFGLVAPKR